MCPEGKLKKSTIEKAYRHLKRIGEILVSSPIDTKELKHQSNCFYSYIPHNYGMQRPPVINTVKMLRSKESLLEVHS